MNSLSENHSDVLIIGGGAIGLACAHELVKSGCTVRIIEKATVGAGASHGNCGLVFVSDLPPLCVPGVIGHELMRTLQGTSPLTIKPRLDPSLAGWLLRFAAHCTARHRRHAMRARERLLHLSDNLLKELITDEQFDCEYAQRGVLMAFMDPRALEGYAATNRLLAPFGLAADYYDRQAVQALEPALCDRVCGGWLHPRDSHLRPAWLVAAWHRKLRREGVRFVENCPLEHLEIRGAEAVAARTPTGRFTADQFVLAAGAWSPRIGRQLGLRLPIQPGKGYSITMQRPAMSVSRPCYLVERSVVVTPWPSGYRLGGTMEFAGFDDRLTEKRLAHITRSAAAYLKTPVGEQVVERWTGLRPMTPDDLPVIDRARTPRNLLVATGHGMLGISMATGTGRLITDLVLGRPPAVDPSPYSMGRFGP